MGLIWDDTGARGKRTVFNPRPKVPKTGWKLSNEFPCLKHAKAICFDVETTDPGIKKFGPGWGRGVGHIIGLAVGTDDGFRRYYPMRHVDGPNCNPQQVLDWASEQLGREQQAKVGHNIIYDLGWLEHEGVHVKGDIYDTWTAEKLLNHYESAALEDCGQRHLQTGKSSSVLYDWAWQMWGTGTAKNENEKRELAMSNLAKIPSSLVGHYAESDVDLPLLIAPIQFDMLEQQGMWDVYRMECDLIPLLVQMRLEGVSVNLDAAEEAYNKINQEIGYIQKRIDIEAGRSINTGSPIEVGLLFDRLGIEYPRTEKTNAPSFKGEFLKTVEHPVAAMIVEIEELKKMNSTFIKGYILEANINGKIHCEFKPMTAVTGRMSSATPNLQNVPSRTELAKVVRAAFVPDSGHDHWRKYDYSSVESRVLAHFAVGTGSKELRKEYHDNPDTDYHNFTIAMIKKVVGITLERKPAKTINFGIIFGMMVRALAIKLGVSMEEAQRLFDTYHDGLPYVKETMKAASNFAEANGFTETITGRRATFDSWEPKYTEWGKPKPIALPFKQAVDRYGPNIKRAHLHKSLNYIIQGSAADLIKSGMVKCWKDGIYDVTGVPRLVVHDETDFSVRGGWNEGAFKEMVHIMETAIKFRVPIKMAGDRGPNWGELKEMK